MSWHRLWDAALDKGVKGTCALQTLFKELCRPSSCFKCSLCDRDVPLNTSCLQHACDIHPDVTNISYEHLRSLLSTANSIDSMDSILNLSKTLSNIHTLWSINSAITLYTCFVHLSILLYIFVYQCVCICPLGHCNEYYY